MFPCFSTFGRLYFQFLFDLCDIFDDEVHIVLVVGGGHLCADSCGAFGNHGIRKSYDIDTLRTGIFGICSFVRGISQ